MFVITIAAVLVFQLFMMVMKASFGHDHDHGDGECDAEDVDAMKGRVMTTVLLRDMLILVSTNATMTRRVQLELKYVGTTRR